MNIRYKLNNLIYEIKCLFKPQHQSLRNTIPRRWRDLDGILEDFLCAVVISYVEEEDGFRHTEWDLNPEELKEYERDNRLSWLEAHKAIKEIYEYIKNERPLYADYEYISDWKLSAEKEKTLQEKDTYYFTQLIKYRRYLWT